MINFACRIGFLLLNSRKSLVDETKFTMYHALAVILWQLAAENLFIVHNERR